MALVYTGVHFAAVCISNLNSACFDSIILSTILSNILISSLIISLYLKYYSEPESYGGNEAVNSDSRLVTCVVLSH